MSKLRQVNLNGMILTVDEENRVSRIVSNGDLIAVQDIPEHMPVLKHMPVLEHADEALKEKDK